MKKRVWMILLAITPIVGFLSIAYAKSTYLTQFNTQYGTAGSALDSCTVCHPSVPARNSFGADFASTAIPGHTAHAFDAALEARDSDSDGFTNIAEINGKTFPGNPDSHPAASDTTPPTVTGFNIPATSNSLTVSITSFTATDNVAVTGYKATESPTAPKASDSGWTASAPSSYTFSTAGAKTLYGWAKDAAGNVSTSESASTTLSVADTAPPTPRLSVGSFSAPRKVSIDLTATDDAGGSGIAGYMVKLSSTPPSVSSPSWMAAPPAAFKFPTAATTGPQTLYAWAKDKAGNVSATVSVQVDLDVTKPTVTEFTAEATSPASATVNISMIAMDPVANGVASGVAAYMVTKSNLTPPSRTSTKWINGSPPTSVTFPKTLKAGATLYAWVKDANGNVSKAKSAKVTPLAAGPIARAAQPAVQSNAGVSKASQGAVADASADMMIWVGKWFKVAIKNEGYYGGKSGFTNDRQTIPGHLKIWDWDPTRQVFSCDLYQQDDRTGEWLSTPLELQYTGGDRFDFKVSSLVVGELTYGFTARIQGSQTSGVLTGATFKTLGGYHVQEAAEGDTARHWAGWLVITGKMVAESEVQVSTGALQH